MLVSDEGQNFLRSISSESTRFESGCTANVVLITEKNIICANSGDSRSFVTSNNVINYLNYLY